MKKLIMTFASLTILTAFNAFADDTNLTNFLAGKGTNLPEQNFNIKCNLSASVSSFYYGSDPVAYKSANFDGIFEISKADLASSKNIFNKMLKKEFLSTLKSTSNLDDFLSTKFSNIDGKEKSVEDIFKGVGLRLALDKCQTNKMEFLAMQYTSIQVGSEFTTRTFDTSVKQGCIEKPSDVKLRNFVSFDKTLSDKEDDREDLKVSVVTKCSVELL